MPSVSGRLPLAPSQIHTSRLAYIDANDDDFKDLMTFRASPLPGYVKGWKTSRRPSTARMAVRSPSEVE
jgi:hypothetical protein